jgi:hypothetical protein
VAGTVTGGTAGTVTGGAPPATGGVAGTVTGGAPPATGGTPPATGGAPPATGGAPPATGGAPPATGGAPPATGGTPPATGGTPPATGGTPPATGGTPPATGGAPPATGGAPPATGGAPSGGTGGFGGAANRVSLIAPACTTQCDAQVGLDCEVTGFDCVTEICEDPVAPGGFVPTVGGCEDLYVGMILCGGTMTASDWTCYGFPEPVTGHACTAAFCAWNCCESAAGDAGLQDNAFIAARCTCP